jgi:hypothetical protein
MQSRREGYDRIDELLAGFTIQKKRTTGESLSLLFVLLRDIHSDNVGTAVVSGKEKKLYTRSRRIIPGIWIASDSWRVSRHKCLAQYELLETNRK